MPHAVHLVYMYSRQDQSPKQSPYQQTPGVLIALFLRMQSVTYLPNTALQQALPLSDYLLPKRASSFKLHWTKID